MDTKEWVERAKSRYGDTYLYDNSSYKNSREKIEIICRIHGPFWQRPDTFLAGHTCQRCGRISSSEKNTVAFAEFEERAKTIFGNQLSFVEESFTGINKQVIAICPDHGRFTKTAADFTRRRRGCPKCSNRVRKTNDEFIEEARKVHGDKYDYSLVEYNNNKSKVRIICPHHGEFEQLAKSHLRGNECVSCSLSFSTSKGEQRWLDEHSVPVRNTNVVFGSKRINVDGYDPETNTVYLYHGDFWHGNPKYYSPNDYNKRSRKTFGELYEKTIANEETIRSAGFNFVRIWESEWFDILRGRGENPPPWYG